jgi:centrosomal protein CEP104
VIVQCIDKLADGNIRIREQGRRGLDLIAMSPQVGPGHVSSHLVKALPPKLKTAWRPIAARLEVLGFLVSEYGLNNNHGLQMDPMLNFAKNTQAFAHSQKEVRDAVKKLIVAIQKIVGTPPLEPILTLLRKNQREEYELAFKGGEAAPPAAAPAKGGGGGGKQQQQQSEHSPSKRTDKSHQHAPHLPGGKVPTSQNKVDNQREGYGNKGGGGGGAGGGQQHKQGAKHSQADEEEEEEKQDFTGCMFCGFSNRKWTENDLDLHYWKDCPLLIACPSCAQIVEIAGLPEHLLDECEAKDDYVPCEVTGKRKRQ